MQLNFLANQLHVQKLCPKMRLIFADTANTLVYVANLASVPTLMPPVNFYKQRSNAP